MNLKIVFLVIFLAIACSIGYGRAEGDEIHISGLEALPYACTQSNTTYILDSDLTAPGTAIIIAASDVTLDLNGHKITYGTLSRSKDHGIILYCGYVHTNNFPNLPSPSPTAWKKANNAIITNRKHDTSEDAVVNIEQGGTGDHSDCIRGVENNGVTINTIKISYRGDSCKGIYILGPRTPVSVYDIVSTSNVTTIDNRHQGYPHIDINGYLKGTENAVKVYNNQIRNGCQLGIRVCYKFVDPDAKSVFPEIYSNQILGTQSLYANDYGIQFMGHNAKIYDNTIDCAPNGDYPGFSRGIQLIGAQDCEVFQNTIKVRSRGNKEYKQYWTHGIKVEADSQFGPVDNNLIRDNNITVYQYYDAEKGITNGGYGLNLSDHTSGQTPVAGRVNRFEKNTVTAIATRAETFYNKDVSCVNLLNVAPGNKATFQDNTFVSNQHVVLFNTSSTSDVVFRHNTINKSGTFDWKLALFWPYKAAHKGIKFIDNIYQNGADSKYTFSGLTDTGSDFSVLWTFDLEVISGGTKASGATVTIKNALGTTVFAGITNASGKLSQPLELPQFKVDRTAPGQPIVLNYTPYTVQISMPHTVTKSLTIDKPQTLSVTLE